MHTDSKFEVAIAVDQSGGIVRVEVTSEGSFELNLPSPTLVQTSGRGLPIVAALSNRWGVRAQETDDTVVWFELDCVIFDV